MDSRSRNSSREWRVKPVAEKNLPSDISTIEALEIEISKNAGLSRIAARVCINRGLFKADDISRYLNPRLDSLTHPFQILDLKTGAEKIISAGLDQKKIRVFTDYDVDGTTGAALLTWFFRDLGFQFDVKQPDRFRDGYGLNVAAIEQAAADGVSVFITVDCGITSHDAIARAKELGLDVIVVDHHQVDPVRGVPAAAFAVINPQRSDDLSGLRQLCGCALAFYLSMGIRALLREQSFFTSQNRSEPNLRELLDLVVIATAADMVPLIGDNRILVKQGLDVLRNTQKPGLKALMEVAGIQVNRVSPMNLGFALGPRINASGRMGSAETAYLCLTTKNPVEGRSLAEELELINQQRAEIQNRIWDEVRVVVENGIKEGRFKHAVVIASDRWHEGVVGIVASRVIDAFQRPAIVLSVREDGIAKGSVRSYQGYHVLQALHQCQGILKSFGGHQFAAGCSLDASRVLEFETAFNQAISGLVPEKNGKVLFLEGECELSELSAEALQQVEDLGPFGPGNPEPLFTFSARIESQQILKGRHLKLRLSSGGRPKSSPSSVDGIWFNAAEQIEVTSWVEKETRDRQSIVFAGVPELNRFRGKTTPTVRVKDARPMSADK